MQILVVVANIPERPRKTDVEKGFAGRPVFGFFEKRPVDKPPVIGLSGRPVPIYI